MDILHEPLTPILRHILTTSALPRNGRVLDLASGAGLKLPLLAEACGPGVTFLALDRDRAAIAECKRTMDGGRWTVARKPENREPRTENRKRGDKETRRQGELSSFSSAVPAVPFHPITRSPLHLLIGAAHALPLADGCCAAACCIAALGLFAAPVAALRELRRVVQPGGMLLVVSGMQAWAAVTRWPAGVAGPLAAAYAEALACGMPAPAAPDLGDDLAAQLNAAGWHAPHTRAFLLDAADAVQAELAMLPWPLLRPLVVAHLDAALLAACDDAAEHCEIELCTLVLATYAKRGNSESDA